MNTRNPILDSDTQIRIERVHAKDNINIQPLFTKFEYTIRDNANYIQDTNETLWRVEGRLERILFADRSSNVVCSPDIILFDLCGHLGLTPIEYKIRVGVGNEKTIVIENVEFYNYGRVFEIGNYCTEVIYFCGTMDYKNIVK